MATEPPAAETSTVRELPMFPLQRMPFPGDRLPLHVFEPRYRELTRRCLDRDRLFGVALIMRGAEVGADPDQERSTVGTLVRIGSARELEDGRWMLSTDALERLLVRRWLPDDPYPRALVEPWPDHPASAAAFAERRDGVLEGYDRMLALLANPRPGAHPQRPRPDMLSSDPTQASYQLCSPAPVGELDRLRLLSTLGPVERLDLLRGLLEDVNETIRLLGGGSSEDQDPHRRGAPPG